MSILRRLLAQLAGQKIDALPAVQPPVVEELPPAPPPPKPPPPSTYGDWIAAFDRFGDAEGEAMLARLQELPPTTVDLMVDATGHSAAELEETLASLERQIHPHWRAWLVGAGPSVGHDAARIVPARDIEEVLSRAKGDYVTFVSAGDRLADHALGASILFFFEAPQLDALYTDEDRLDPDGARADPWFKGGWNPDRCMTQGEPLRLGMIRRRILQGAPPKGASSAEEFFFDLWYRLAIRGGTKIGHLPQALYHRGSGAPGGQSASFASILASLLAEEGKAAEVRTAGQSGWRRIAWAVPRPEPRVSVCIPTRDRTNLLAACIEGLREKTDWPDLEIIIVDNGSEKSESLDYLSSLAADPRIRVLRSDEPFNYSRLNNLAAAEATGDLLCLLNNDIAMIEPSWLRELAGHALRPEVGAAGPMLLYENGRVQHAGIVLGLGGGPAHIHKKLPGDRPGHGGRLQVAQEVSAVTGACLLTRLSVYRDHGGLDEDLPVAYNDVDYCLRLRRSGLRILFTPHARLLHLESESRGRDADDDERQARLVRDKALMRERWGAALDTDPFYSPNLTNTANNCTLAWPPRFVPSWRVPQ